MMSPLGRGTAAAFVFLAVLSGWLVGEESPVVRYVTILAAFLGTVVLQHWRRLYAVARTLPRDLEFLYHEYCTRQVLYRYQKEDTNVISTLEEHVKNTPNKVCFRFEHEKWTYRDVNNYANRVARAFQRRGLGRGDVVALIMANQIEYICIWLGLAKLGAVTALINYNLRDAPLAHTINTARAKAVLFGPGYAEAVLGVKNDLQTVEAFYQFGDTKRVEGAEVADNEWFTDFVALLEKESTETPVIGHTIGHHDHVMFIYTSGTTGLPKAAIVTHSRVMYWPMGWGVILSSLSPDSDTHYCCLPMYHAAAGGFAASLALTHGIPVIYSRKFSASRFWSDCVEHGATCAQYIGELCRFLVSSPVTPAEQQHKVRVLMGNGMSRPVWERVSARFGVKKIIEFYGSTEGNIVLANPVGKMGAIGFLPRLLPQALSAVDVVRVDEESGDPIRDAVTGFCVRCKEGEPGMAIGKIHDRSIAGKFFGYQDRKATEKKILRDAFENGDKYFVSGDIVEVDELGFVYFKDRTGDTFRWKGENVSTTEVESVITAELLSDGVREVAVYGVQVPGNEGRAGMAAIADAERKADLGHLSAALARKLPAYARPLFVRVAPALPLTGTHKVSKVTLQREGYDITKVHDDVYFWDSKAAHYAPLTQEILRDITDAKVRV